MEPIAGEEIGGQTRDERTQRGRHYGKRREEKDSILLKGSSPLTGHPHGLRGGHRGEFGPFSGNLAAVVTGGRQRDVAQRQRIVVCAVLLKVFRRKVHVRSCALPVEFKTRGHYSLGWVLMGRPDRLT